MACLARVELLEPDEVGEQCGRTMRANNAGTAPSSQGNTKAYEFAIQG